MFKIRNTDLTEEQKEYYNSINKQYKQLEKEFCDLYEIKLRKKDYISADFFQYLVVEYQKYLFSIDYQLLINDYTELEKKYHVYEIDIEENKKEYNRFIKYTKKLKDYPKDIIEEYQAKINNEDEEFSYLKVKKSLGHAIDILIRHIMTNGKYIRQNNETKQDLYCNGLYRCFKYAIYTYTEEKAKAFVYFSSAIENGFKEELNNQSHSKNISNEIIRTQGLNSILKNIDSTQVLDLEKDYELETFNDFKEKENVPFIIKQLNKDYPIISLRLLEEANVARFLRKYHTYEFCIPVIYDTPARKTKSPYKINSLEDISKNEDLELSRCIILEFIDIAKVNEENGQRKSEQRNRNIIARKNGHQVLTIYSDMLDINTIKNKIDSIKELILDNSNISGRLLDSDYIAPDYFLDNIDDISEPLWYMIDAKKEKRHLVLSQSIEEYMRLKTIDRKITRLYNSGMIK